MHPPIRCIPGSTSIVCMCTQVMHTSPIVYCVFLLLPELSFVELQLYQAFFSSCTIHGCPCIKLEYVCLCVAVVHRTQNPNQNKNGIRFHP